MAISILADHTFGDTTVRYLVDDASRRVGLWMFPAALAGALAERRADLREERPVRMLPGSPAVAAWNLDPLVHLHGAGDQLAHGFAAGLTLRGGPSAMALALVAHEARRGEGCTRLVTTLSGPRGLVVEHVLTAVDGLDAFSIDTAVTAAEALTLELLTSFSLGGITPFDRADAPRRLRLHRFHSTWSGEGRHEDASFESLHLERSWVGHSVQALRFGQVGSMPVRGWFPTIAVEDSGAGVLWGAQLCWAGSWQLEVYRRDDCASVSGGLADRDLGQWSKRLAAGERLAAPTAWIACARGGIEDLCDRLVRVQERAAAAAAPAIERDLPVACNEYCLTWGNPTHDRLVALADRLRGSDVRYLVIDAGWWGGGTGWAGHGDWDVRATSFPQGLGATAAAIRERGLIPGLWFEFETVAQGSAAYDAVDHLLKRDGRPLTVGTRRFWDMRDPWVQDYLGERVIRRLRDDGFGYLKVDYNDSIGPGCDGPGGFGEELRLQILATQDFFRRLRRELPDLVIENCASGGHRLEPSMMALCSQASFSDAHETDEIPIIAAALHRLVAPRQSQIWAVLRAGDDDRRARYLLAGGFLGRLCLSGELDNLSPERWDAVRAALALYRRATPVIASGRSRRHGPALDSWRHPRGWQAVVRDDGARALVVAHAFSDAPATVEVPLPGTGWRVAGALAAQAATVSGDRLLVAFDGAFSASVTLLER